MAYRVTEDCRNILCSIGVYKTRASVHKWKTEAKNINEDLII